MQFTAFNKAIAATVGAILIIAGLFFKQDLSGYGDLITGVLAALVPILVYVVPNVAAEIEDGGKLADVITKEGDVATTIGTVASGLKNATPPKA